MTRARILADYVAGGTTAAEFDYLDGLTSTAVGINDTQTLANKTLASTTSFPAGVILKVQQFIVGTGTSSINSTAWAQYHTFDYSPHGGANNTSKIICIFHANVESQSDTAEG